MGFKRFVYFFKNNSYQLNKFVFYIFLITSSFNLKAQGDLVPNGSFEEFWECPSGEGQLNNVKFWYKPNFASTDYYNSCQTDENLGISIPNNWFGYQFPYHGNGYIGVGIYLPSNETASEYIQVKLLEPLQSCTFYKVRFWVSLADFSSLTSTSLGARFDYTPITNSNYDAFQLSPHIYDVNFLTDTSEWKLFSGLYYASGGEEFLSIGRFLATSDSMISIPYTSVQCSNCFQPENAYYYIDSVSVIKSEEDEHFEAPNVFTCNDDYINDYWFPTNICFNDWKCVILNRWGETIYKFNSTENGWNGTDLKENLVSKGVYFYIIESKDRKQSGFIHLLR